MKFFDLFGKTSRPAARHVRAPDSAVAQRDATARKIDNIESEIAAELGIVTLSAAVPADPAVLLGQQIDEACLLHASGQSAAAAALLADATAQPLPAAAERERLAWQMRMELASFNGGQQRFEEIALAYAQRFETSPPQWRAPPVTDATWAAPLPTLSFRGRLCGSAAPALGQLAQMAARHPRFRLDLGGVTELDAEGCRLLLQLLYSWQEEDRMAGLIAADALLLQLRAQVQPGRRDGDDAAWYLLLEVLRASGDLQGYEEACIAYSTTFELSPPAAPAPLSQGRPPAGRLTLPAEIRFPVDELLAGARDACRNASCLLLDCRQLRRIEFNAAAPMLSGIVRVAEGKTVEWHDIPFVVSTLLRLVGGDGGSKIIHRKP